VRLQTVQKRSPRGASSRAMCWSAEVSFITTGAEILMLGAIWVLPKCRPYAMALTPTALTVITVELSEGLSWPYVQSLQERLNLSPNCPTANMVWTTVLYLAVMCQPLSASLLASRTPPGVEYEFKQAMTVIRVLSVMNVLGVVLAMVLTFARPVEARPHLVNGLDKAAFPWGLYYITTCAYEGPHGHQMWQIANASDFTDLMPNLFAYFSVGLVGLPLFYDKWESIFWACFVAVFGALRLAWNAGEAGSLWCWTGLAMFTFYLVFPYVKSALGLPTVTSWSYFLPCLPSKAGGSHAAHEPPTSTAPVIPVAAQATR